MIIIIDILIVRIILMTILIILIVMFLFPANSERNETFWPVDRTSFVLAQWHSAQRLASAPTVMISM